MNIFNLIFFFSFLKEMFTNSINFDSFSKQNNNEEDLLSRLNLIEHLNTILSEIYNKSDSDVSKGCLDKLRDNYDNKSVKIEDMKVLQKVLLT